MSLAARIVVHGATGRMGQALLRLLTEGSYGDALCLHAALARPGHPLLGKDIGGRADGHASVLFSDDIGAALNDATGVIDFSQPAALTSLMQACIEHRVPLVTGTTGLDADIQRALDKLAAHVPVVVAPNTSLGVHVLQHLAKEALRLLGPGFDAEIVEMHHRRKVDAPSGTALALAQCVAEQKKQALDSVMRTGREGQTGARSADEIGVMALRGGNVIGEHTLFLTSDYERLELTHRAQDRSLFAAGALRAMQWLLSTKPAPKIYGMGDVLLS